MALKWNGKKSWVFIIITEYSGQLTAEWVEHLRWEMYEIYRRKIWTE